MKFFFIEIAFNITYNARSLCRYSSKNEVIANHYYCYSYFQFYLFILQIELMNDFAEWSYHSLTD